MTTVTTNRMPTVYDRLRERSASVAVQLEQAK